MRKKGFTFWALSSSVAIHVIALLLLCVIKLKSADHEQFLIVPLASVYSPMKEVVPEPVTPKPAIVMPQIIEPDLVTTNTHEKGSYESQVISSFPEPEEIPQPIPNIDSTREQPQLSIDENVHPLPQQGTVFFKHRCTANQICLVIDCSGSMKGIYPQVLAQIKSFVSGLAPNQFFSLVLFGNGIVSTLDGQKLLQASTSNINTAINFASSFSPSGTTNAQDALNAAFSLRDYQGRSAQQIYMVTDGFELVGSNSKNKSKAVGDLLNNCPKETKITIIAFWPESGDLELLDAIAAKTGGDVVLIKD